MKRSYFIIVFICLTYLTNAQTFPDNYFKGELVTNDGSSYSGYIYYNILKSDAFQVKVHFATDSQYETMSSGGKVKYKDIQKFKAKEVKEINFENGQKFAAIKTVDPNVLEIGTPKLVLEILVDGEVRLYCEYLSLEGVISGATASLAVDGSDEEKEEYIMANTGLYVQREGEAKATTISGINLTDYLADKPEILEKFKSKEYGEEPKDLDTLVKLFEDYNSQ